MIINDIKEMLFAAQLGNSQSMVCVGLWGKGIAVYVENGETKQKTLVKTFYIKEEKEARNFANGYSYGWSDGRADFASMF